MFKSYRGSALIAAYIAIALLLTGSSLCDVSNAAGSSWYAGTWDSTINNLMDHPKTVALRIEVVDKETREPIPNAEVSFEGEYWIAPRTSRHPEGEREAQEVEYKLTCQTDSHGIAVGAFGWQKEYPWSLGTDEIEKAQRIEVRHSQYKYVELKTPFYRFLDVGQKKTKPYPSNEDTSQDPRVFEEFEKAWPLECAKRNVKFFVLDLGTDDKDFDNKESKKTEFFNKVRDKEWSVVFDKPQNLMKWGKGSGRSWCGPYFVYLIEIQMERRSGQIEVISEETDESKAKELNSVLAESANVTTDNMPSELSERTWKCPACGHIYQSDVAPNFCPQCGYSPARSVTQPKIQSKETAKQEGKTDQKNSERLKQIAETDPLGIAVEKLTPQLATELFGFPYGLSVNVALGNLIIRYVLPGSPADKADLKKNDIFVSVKLPDQGFYSIVMFSSADDYRKMFDYQVMRNAVILDVSGFQFPTGYRYKQGDAIYDYFFRTSIEWNKGANAPDNSFTSEISDRTESDNLEDQEKRILDETLKGFSEISLPSFDQIKKDPSTLFELMEAFQKAKQDVTIAAIRAIPVKDPETDQMTTFDQFARKAVATMDLGSTGSFFRDDPIAATYMMVFDKKFLLENVPLVKTSDDKYVSLTGALENSEIAGDKAESLRAAVDGLSSAYDDGQSDAVLVALKQIVPVIAQFSRKQAIGDEVQTGLEQEKTIDLGNGVTIEFVLIPAGSFYMGSPSSEKDRDSDEGPVHRVQITQSFYLSKYEVTQDQYMAVMGGNPSHFSGRNLPIDSVTWNEAVSFCTKIGGRLPTEAEWEYACRAGSDTRFSYGDDLRYSQLSEYAWCDGNKGTHGVGQKKPNSFGLYDMHGNVWEWCSDWYADSYRNSVSVNPTGPSSGSSRVLRGGGWSDSARYCRSANSYRYSPDYRFNCIGFRVALDF